MKNFNNLVKVITVLCCLLTSGYAQELIATAVNSPRAIILNAQFENIKEELEKKESEYSLLKEDTRKENKVKKQTLEKSIDSLSKCFFEVRKLYAVEILRSDENQEVIKRMNEALLSGPKELAGKISWEYRRKLMDRATKRWLAKEIDRSTFRTELRAIDKIEEALATVVFVPRRLSSGGHQHK